MPKSALIKVYSIQGMHLFCYHDVKQTRFKIELIKINTTNYYIIESRENFVSTTELEEQLRDILDDKFPDYKFIETKKLAFQLYGVEDGFMQNRKDYQTIKYYMEHMGYKETRIRRDNKRTRGFVKS